MDQDGGFFFFSFLEEFALKLLYLREQGVRRD